MGTCEGKFLVMALTATGESQNGPLLIGQDNKSCIQIAENPGRHHGLVRSRPPAAASAADAADANSSSWDAPGSSGSPLRPPIGSR